MARESDGSDVVHIQKGLHVNYFHMLLRCLPEAYISFQTNRMMALYFCVSGLDLLDALDTITNKQELIDWIYQQQCEEGGFIGGGFTPPHKAKIGDGEEYRQGHVTLTYTALAALAVLGDDYSRVNKEQMVKWLSTLQNEDGSFKAVTLGSETDARFVFSAVAICFMIGNYDGIDIQKTLKFMLSLQSYDGGIGVLPGQESHAGKFVQLVLTWLTYSTRTELLHMCFA